MGPTKLSRLSRRLHRRHRVTKQPALFEPLEGRQLFAAQLLSVVGPVLAHPANPSQDTIDLSTHLRDSLGAGTIARFHTTQGDFEIALTDSVTPGTVANFIHYTNSGAYDKTIFSRSVAGFVEQLGGYNIDKLGVHIPVQQPIPNEFNTANPVHNVRGTVAMALSGGSNNTAQSEWFVNLADNSANLDTQSGGFTVFGTVVGDGMTIIDKIAALPKASIAKKTGNGALTDVPLQNYNSTKSPAAPIFTRNLVEVISARSTPAMTYSISSDNPSLVQPILTNGRSLTFSYGSGKTGVANITVIGTSTDDGSTVTNTFAVTVPAASGGLQTSPDTPTNVFVNTPAQLTPLANDTDSASPINPASLTITTQPAHGTAVVNTTTGTITYTPQANFAGADTIHYTVRNAANTASSPTTISFTVGATPGAVSIGSSTAKSVTWHEPDGTTGHLSVTGGTAVVTFASSDVQTTTSGGVINVTGTGATISDIVITNATNHSAAVTITASGGTDGLATIGGIHDAGAVTSIVGSTVNLIGTLDVGSLTSLTLGNTNDALIKIGPGPRATTVSITNAADTSILAAGTLGNVRTNRWVNTDGIADTITASSMGALSCPGEFAAGLVLTSTATGLRSAAIGGNLTGGAWNITGSMGSLSARTAASTWSLNSGGTVGAMHFSGDLPAAITAKYGAQSLFVGGNHSAAFSATFGAVGTIRVNGNESGDVLAGSIGNFTVGGNLQDKLTLTSVFFKGSIKLGVLNVVGGINNTIINSTGDIGTIMAKSLTGSQIWAGALPATVTANALPSQSDALAAVAQISQVRLGAGSTASPSFSNSKIVALRIGSEILGVVQNDNAGASEGTAAVTFGSIHATLAAGGTLNLGRAQLSEASTLSQFLSQKGIVLKDFTIDVMVPIGNVS